MRCSDRSHALQPLSVLTPGVRLPLCPPPCSAGETTVLKLALRSVSDLRETDGGGIELSAARTTRIVAARGRDVPYEHDSSQATYVVTLAYAAPAQLFRQLSTLVTAWSRAEPAQRDAEVAAVAEQVEAAAQFDMSQLRSFSERILLQCRAVQLTPLVREPGILVVTDKNLYFQPRHNLAEASPARCRPLASVGAVAPMRVTHQPRAVELHFLTAAPGEAFGSGAFFEFKTANEAEAARQALNERAAAGELAKDSPLGSQAAAQVLDPSAGAQWLVRVCAAWRAGAISNFDFLSYLNLLAGRSTNDLSQWPVFPWVLADYESPTLDLSKPATFRDLSKPIGALNPQRLATLRRRMEQMPRNTATEGRSAPYLYGTHYSTPGYVLYWMVRSAPAHMLRLQNGRFDAPDRLFCSVRDSWRSVLSNPADLKELVPEFYASSSPASGRGAAAAIGAAAPGAFLLNSAALPLGRRQSGAAVGDVELPPWADSPADFVAKNRQALECEHVSAHLHEWIELIFGHKQRGEAAMRADNLFHPLTYEGSVDLDAVADPVERAGMEAQINEFGQCPARLFASPLAKRASSATSGEAAAVAAERRGAMGGGAAGGAYATPVASLLVTLAAAAAPVGGGLGGTESVAAHASHTAAAAAAQGGDAVSAAGGAQPAAPSSPARPRAPSEEMDVASRVEGLCRRHKYTAAVPLTLDEEGEPTAATATVYRRYGDYLYGRRDYDGAMEQYTRTIGHLAPSYVIRKYLEAQRIHALTTYLERLHEVGGALATPDHTTLLLNCYTKLRDADKLTAFVDKATAPGAPFGFDHETAIGVLSAAGYHEHALQVAASAGQAQWQLRILLEDLQRFDEALAFIAGLDLVDAVGAVKRYGKALVDARPEAATAALAQLCMGSGEARASPEEFAHLFVEQPRALMLFYEFVVNSTEAAAQGGEEGQPAQPAAVYNTLLELYLGGDADDDDGSADGGAEESSSAGLGRREERLAKVTTLLRSGWPPGGSPRYDAEAALVLCRLHGFVEGSVLLCERLSLFSEALAVIIASPAAEHGPHAVIEYARRAASAASATENTIAAVWRTVLQYLGSLQASACEEAAAEALAAAEASGAVPPLESLRLLAGNPRITLGAVRPFLSGLLERQSAAAAEDGAATRRYRDEAAAMRAEVVELRGKARVFQNASCASCHGALDLPAVHFVCGHSYHARCLGGGAGGGGFGVAEADECPLCAPAHRTVREVQKALHAESGDHDKFFQQLANADSGEAAFTVIADHFGRSLLDKQPKQTAAQALAALDI